jgi:hypothetical protein
MRSAAYVVRAAPRPPLRQFNCEGYVGAGALTNEAVTFDDFVFQYDDHTDAQINYFQYSYGCVVQTSGWHVSNISNYSSVIWGPNPQVYLAGDCDYEDDTYSYSQSQYATAFANYSGFSSCQYGVSGDFTGWDPACYQQ